MMQVRDVVPVGAALLFALALAQMPGVAIATMQPGTTYEYTVAIRPRFTQGREWSGNLELKVTSSGVVSGSYRSTSAIGDPFSPGTITVSGTENGKTIDMTFHMTPPRKFSVQGQFSGDNIDGTATDQNSRIYTFVAQRVRR